MGRRMPSSVNPRLDINKGATPAPEPVPYPDYWKNQVIGGKDPREILKEYLYQTLTEGERERSVLGQYEDREQDKETFAGRQNVDMMKAMSNLAQSFGTYQGEAPKSTFSTEPYHKSYDRADFGREKRRVDEQNTSAQTAKILQYLAEKKQREADMQAEQEFKKSLQQLKTPIEGMTDYQKAMIGLKRQDLANEKAKIKPTLTPARKAMETTLAKDYSEWSTGGRSQFSLNLERLKSARERLRKVISGGMAISGRFGPFPRADWSLSDEGLAIRNDVHAAALGALKSYLGSAFTEKEGERVMSQSYDQNQSPEHNLTLIDRSIRDLESQAQAKEAMATQFEDTGEFSGWRDRVGGEQSPGKFPMKLYKNVNGKNNSVTVSNEKELQEAQSEGWK